jgi:hypothetical protein
MKKFKNRKGGEIYQRCISGIEEFHSQVQGWIWSNSVFLSPDELGKDQTYDVIHKMYNFLYAQYQVKYAELTGGLIDSLNNKQYMVFALCARNLLELTAVLRYYTKKLEPIIDDAAKTGIFTYEQQKTMLDIIDQHARGGRFNWNEFNFGDHSSFAEHLVEMRRKKDKHPAIGSAHILEKVNPEQVNVLTAIERWASEEPGVLLTYEYFCELVHPNLGSNFLVMGSDANRLVVGKRSTKDVAKDLCVRGLPMIASTAIREGALYMSKFVLIKEMGEASAVQVRIH